MHIVIWVLNAKEIENSRKNKLAISNNTDLCISETS